MNIVVLGKMNKALNALEKIAKNNYHYVSTIDDALGLIEENVAELLVIEDWSGNSQISEIIKELNRMPQVVRLILINSSLQYFIFANKSQNCSVNYHFSEK
jgi:hypothetical protein